MGSHWPIWGPLLGPPQAPPAFLPASSTLHPPCRIGRSPLASPPALGTILTPAPRNQLLICLTPHWTCGSLLGQLSLSGDLWNAWRHTWLSHLATGPLAWSGGSQGCSQTLYDTHGSPAPAPQRGSPPKMARRPSRWQGDSQDVRRAEVQKACCPGRVPWPVVDAPHECLLNVAG